MNRWIHKMHVKLTFYFGLFCCYFFILYVNHTHTHTHIILCILDCRHMFTNIRHWTVFLCCCCWFFLNPYSLSHWVGVWAYSRVCVFVCISRIHNENNNNTNTNSKFLELFFSLFSFAAAAVVCEHVVFLKIPFPCFTLSPATYDCTTPYRQHLCAYICLPSHAHSNTHPHAVHLRISHIQKERRKKTQTSRKKMKREQQKCIVCFLGIEAFLHYIYILYVYVYIIYRSALVYSHIAFRLCVSEADVHLAHNKQK